MTTRSACNTARTTPPAPSVGTRMSSPGPVSPPTATAAPRRARRRTRRGGGEGAARRVVGRLRRGGHRQLPHVAGGAVVARRGLRPLPLPHRRLPPLPQGPGPVIALHPCSAGWRGLAGPYDGGLRRWT